jgi:hypothetical protein
MTVSRLLPAIIALLTLLNCAPIMPQRSKPGGAARWATALAQNPSILWAQDAQLCRVVGLGVGNDGWLPDRGGNWTLTFWSAEHPEVLEVAVDSDGGVKATRINDSPHRGYNIPVDWKDSSTVWAATRSHQIGEPLNTFEVELSRNAEPERFPGETVWRIRFFMVAGGFESHIVDPQGKWLAQY